MNEEMIKQITEIVQRALKESGRTDISDADLTAAVVQTVNAYLHTEGEQPPKKNPLADGAKADYSSFADAKKGTDPKEVIIGVGPAFQRQIRYTINGLSHEDVLKNIKAGIEEEGMIPRVVKVLDTSDVCFMGLEVAKMSGSGIGIGLQSKGTVVIHQKDLYPLSNLELFPQAPLMTLEHYRRVGQNAAKYAKGEQVKPIECENDPMCRAKYQVKAALMHILETEQIDPSRPFIEWNV